MSVQSGLKKLALALGVGVLMQACGPKPEDVGFFRPNPESSPGEPVWVNALFSAVYPDCEEGVDSCQRGEDAGLGEIYLGQGSSLPFTDSDRIRYSSFFKASLQGDPTDQDALRVDLSNRQVIPKALVASGEEPNNDKIENYEVALNQWGRVARLSVNDLGQPIYEWNPIKPVFVDTEAGPVLSTPCVGRAQDYATHGGYFKKTLGFSVVRTPALPWTPAAYARFVENIAAHNCYRNAATLPHQELYRDTLALLEALGQLRFASHNDPAIKAVFDGEVTRGLLECAGRGVACPMGAVTLIQQASLEAARAAWDPKKDPHGEPTLASVNVPTDEAAIRWAYDLLSPFGNFIATQITIVGGDPNNPNHVLDAHRYFLFGDGRDRLPGSINPAVIEFAKAAMFAYIAAGAEFPVTLPFAQERAAQGRPVTEFGNEKIRYVIVQLVP